jgi:hypothetical protein
MADRNQKRRTRRIVAAGFCSVAALTMLGIASCSLNLDEAQIGRVSEAGIDETSVVDTFVKEGGDGALPPINPEAGICAKDEDCKGTTGCFVAKCDVPRKACVFQVCRQPACNSATCDVTSNPTKCLAAKPYKYRAAQFPVGASVGCGGVGARCFAVVYPFVFVGTTNGVLAFSAADPQSATPTPVPVVGLTFLPTQIIASGSRIYFLGTPGGTGMNSRLPIAYADVPPDPFAAKIFVTTILATYARPAIDAVTLFPRGSDTSLIVDLTAAAAYASTPVEPPLVEPAAFGAQGITFTAGSAPVAMSGSRLVMGQISPTNVASFAFVTGAGSNSPTTAPDVAIATATPASGPQFFAQSADGAVFWAHASLGPPPVVPNPQLIRAAKGYFLVAGAAAVGFDAMAGLDLEVYNIPVGNPTVGPVAMLDAKMAMVTTSIPTNLAQTNVGFVTRTPLAILKNLDATPRRFQITLPVSQLAAVGSNGLGYVLAVDPAPAGPVTVYVFDPACAP